MTELLNTLKANVSQPLWLITAAAWAFFHVRAKMREGQKEDDQQLSRQIHTGLTAWANNGGGQQIRLIVRDELHAALNAHTDRCPALRKHVEG